MSNTIWSIIITITYPITKLMTLTLITFIEDSPNIYIYISFRANVMKCSNTIRNKELCNEFVLLNLNMFTASIVDKVLIYCGI